LTIVQPGRRPKAGQSHPGWASEGEGCCGENRPHPNRRGCSQGNMPCTSFGRSSLGSSQV
jgi:hypothetical protein